MGDRHLFLYLSAAAPVCIVWAYGPCKLQGLSTLFAPKQGVQRVPALRVFWDFEKTVLHETRVSGTVLWSPTNANSPTYMYISQKTC